MESERGGRREVKVRTLGGVEGGGPDRSSSSGVLLFSLVKHGTVVVGGPRVDIEARMKGHTLRGDEEWRTTSLHLRTGSYLSEETSGREKIWCKLRSLQPDE